MTSKMIYHNASITQIKLPKMIQTQIQATNMRWGGTTLKICNPVSCQCQIQLFTTIDSHTIIGKQKCDDQIWMTEKEILSKRWPRNSWLELDEKSIHLPQCFNNSIQTSNNGANTNPSNQYEMRRDDLKKFVTLSHVNAEYNYLKQLTLTL